MRPRLTDRAALRGVLVALVTAALTRRGWWFAGMPVGAAVNVASSAIAGELLFSIVACI